MVQHCSCTTEGSYLPAGGTPGGPTPGPGRMTPAYPGTHRVPGLRLHPQGCAGIPPGPTLSCPRGRKYLQVRKLSPGPTKRQVPTVCRAALAWKGRPQYPRPSRAVLSCPQGWGQPSFWGEGRDAGPSACPFSNPFNTQPSRSGPTGPCHVWSWGRPVLPQPASPAPPGASPGRGWWLPALLPLDAVSVPSVPCSGAASSGGGKWVSASCLDVPQASRGMTHRSPSGPWPGSLQHRKTRLLLPASCPWLARTLWLDLGSRGSS